MGQGGAYRRPQRAGAFSVNDPEPSYSRHGRVVQVPVEHLERLLGSRASYVELKRNARCGSLYHRAIRTDRHLGRLRRGPELRRRHSEAQRAGRHVRHAAVVDRKQGPRLGDPLHVHR